ncbi:MAG TPA: ATP-binding protein [Haliscomenobacter sp.]|uniref:AAA family ATPase n=1 Tax=Haliscomenobacter sp. TaxID=2717303 RepID=UPI002B72C21A|nr:ATP-binding protein [Haliscomenobacter sp.]HOY19350.1 ATP-binding protein [Haliscomenobacter sp.]
MSLIGRQREKAKFAEIMESDQPAFVAIYGRRRVGKTFLIKEFFNHQFAFYTTGLANSNTKTQLLNFTIALNATFGKEFKTPKNWLSAFALLQTELSKISGPCIIFIDELPWLDTKKSDFLTGLEFFWNSWASAQKGLKLFVCGSAAAWMINELIRNKGGLYNRVTHRIKIEPFTLQETEQFLQSKGILFDRYQIVNLYMVMGGIPYYLEQVKKGLSATQNIEKICFEETGLLQSEFKFTFSSLFKNAAQHEQILRKIYELGSRATRENLVKKANVPSSGDLTSKLNELEESGFLKSYVPFGGNKNRKIYVISDYYTLFYLRFVENAGTYEAGNWVNRINDPAINVWAGLAFEQICWDHVRNIKKALGIEGIYSETSSWYKAADPESGGAQIDLIIDRKDRVINLFEIKFSINPFEITKAYDLVLRNKIAAFIQSTKTKKAVFLVMLTTFGLLKNEYARSVVQNDLKMDDLFGG